eukprot:7899908-Pyramimonas_sp.AAC.1
MELAWSAGGGDAEVDGVARSVCRGRHARDINRSRIEIRRRLRADMWRECPSTASMRRWVL